MLTQKELNAARQRNAARKRAERIATKKELSAPPEQAVKVKAVPAIPTLAELITNTDAQTTKD